ncbi:hypothetical protein T12_11090, partial [Trichinella patagoniensis]
SGGVKKKKKHSHHYNNESHIGGQEYPSGGSSGQSTETPDEVIEANKIGEESTPQVYDDHLTPAERRYIEQRGKIDQHLMAKTANKSHRDRIQ